MAKLMRRLASFVALFILLSAAAPLLACMTGNGMTQEETACCRDMHGNCGNMTAMGCCRTEVRTDSHPQLAVTTPSVRMQWTLVAWLAPVSRATDTALPSLLQSPRQYSPPGLLLAQLAVLQI